MAILNLDITDFKNISQAKLTFCKGVNCFVGKNGVGKTNILDAIYYLSMCKSCFNAQDSVNVRHGSDFFIIRGTYNMDSAEYDIYCAFKNGAKKVFRKDGKAYDRISDHLGLIPLVMVSPEETSLIDGGSDGRRRMMDMVITQYDRNYMHSLIKYGKALVQRNSLIRSMGGRMPDNDLLEVWNNQLAQNAEVIMQGRLAFVKEFQPYFEKYYHSIVSVDENVTLEYKPSVDEGNFEEALKHSLNRDVAIGYTTVGTHKDEVMFNIDGYPIRKLGSQGQKKSFLIALKLAQYACLFEKKSVRPLLLLDDIFDKLDSDRVRNIVRMLSDDVFGQIFITDTDRNRIDEILALESSDYKLFSVTNGEINEI